MRGFELLKLTFQSLVVSDRMNPMNAVWLALSYQQTIFFVQGPAVRIKPQQRGAPGL
jgi:hypothetical protein